MELWVRVNLEALDGRIPLWAKTVASLLILVAADLRAATGRRSRSGIAPDLSGGYFNKGGRSEVGRYLNWLIFVLRRLAERYRANLADI